MQAFTTHRGVVAVLDRANVDTDQIIPKQFLKSIRRTGFGEALFFDWRYLPDGRDNPEFILNDPAFKGASILVSGNNFGCGSSREHAVWAVLQYGFRAVIAPRQQRGDTSVPAFADIFRNNAFNNGLLVVELGEPEVAEIMRAAVEQKGLQATIDLARQAVVVHARAEKTYAFDIPAGVKERLLRGLDEIGLTLEHAAAIAAFEQRHDAQWPRV